MKHQATRVISYRPLPTLDFPRPTVAPTHSRAVLYLIGLIGGLFGGLLGIGGGSAIAPLLLLSGKLSPARISGTTLATVLLVAVVGSGAYASLGHMNLGLVWPIATGSAAGAVLGAMMAKRLSTLRMIGLFLLILPYFAVKEFWPSLAAPSVATNIATLGALGLGAGIMGGLLGISGASILVPSLVAFFTIDHHAAQGVAITVALSDSLAGVATHARAGNIDYRVLAYLAVPAVVAALIGALVSNSLPSSVLSILFGSFLTAIWLLMLTRFVKERLRDRKTPDAPLEGATTVARYTGIRPIGANGRKNTG